MKNSCQHAMKSKPKHNIKMPKYENQDVKRAPPKTQPKYGNAKIMNKVKIEYTRIFDKLEALVINMNAIIGHAMGSEKARTPKIKQVWVVPNGTIMPTQVEQEFSQHRSGTVEWQCQVSFGLWLSFLLKDIEGQVLALGIQFNIASIS